MTSLLSLLLGGSETLGLATTLIPLLGRANEMAHADEWIYGKLPANFKSHGTLEEYRAAFVSGKQFISDIYNILH